MDYCITTGACQLEKWAKGSQDGLAAKVLVAQAWSHKENPWNPGEGRREVTQGSCPLASIQVPQHVSPHDTHTH